MKAVVFHAAGDVRIEEVASPRLEADDDALVRITRSAVSSTDLRVARGDLAGTRPGTVLGREGVGVVEETGRAVRDLVAGDRVVVAPTIACGACVRCRAGLYAQCDVANPNGPLAGTAYFGGPAASGSFDGTQAEQLRVPYANVGLVRLPGEVSDEQALLLSDLVPSAYFAAELARIAPGESVAVFGCGPVGLFAILCSYLLGAGRVLAVDSSPARLERARAGGAETIDPAQEDPVEAIRARTGGLGADRAINALAADAVSGVGGPALGSFAERAEGQPRRPARPGLGADAGRERELSPNQALRWAVEAVAKAGTVAVVGLHPPGLTGFPIGRAVERNLTLSGGHCNHRRYIPSLVDQVRAGSLEPLEVLGAAALGLDEVPGAYGDADARELEWAAIALTVAAGA